MARGVGVELLIKHEAKPSALSCNETPTPFDFAAHSYSGREIKRTAAAVNRDEKTPPSDPLAKKAIAEPEEAQSLCLMLML